MISSVILLPCGMTRCLFKSSQTGFQGVQPPQAPGLRQLLQDAVEQRLPSWT